MNELNFKTTAEIKIPKNTYEQIIGQEEATNLIKKIAKQRRNLLLIGIPGIGKSMVGQALAELLPKEKLVDVLAYPNLADENVPIIKTVKRGEGRKILTKAKLQSMSSFRSQNIFFFILLILAVISPWWIRKEYGDVMAAASLIGSMIFLAAFILFINLGKRMKLTGSAQLTPKLLIDNSKTQKIPFIDATGAHSGALLGDVLHDPLQSFSDNNIILKHNKKINISKEIDKLLKKHKNNLIKKNNYTATYLNKNELQLLTEKNNKLQHVEVLSVNKYKSNKPHLIKITTETGKQLITTPEHKVAINKKGKIIYKEIKNLTKSDKVITLS
ncbi:MAG: ATP-binding protein [Nanoarchaeota archaeon]|nr:ATP-binding protein [Nanoarchaeota archaeon]